jgi:exosortase
MHLTDTQPAIVPHPPTRFRLPAVSFLQLTLLLIVLGFLYHHVIARLVWQWLNDPNYSHGVLVPFCSAVLLWSTRKSWMGKPLEPAMSGIVLVIAALGLLIAGSLGAELFLTRVSLCLVVGGLVAYFAGWRMLRLGLAPWLVLFLMVPLPVVVFNQIAFPLQVLASHLAASCLDFFRVPVLREGNILVLPTMSLNIVEACSGLRSLMSMLTVAVVYSLFFESHVWIRGLLIAAAVPVAVLANALRIALAAVLAEYVSPTLAEGFFHAFSGFILFLLSLGALVALHFCGNRLARSRFAL